MIHIIISAYGEPRSTERAVNSFLKQKIKEKFKIIVMDPFPDVKEYLIKKFEKIKEFEFFEDPGEGKSYALNLILKRIYSENKNDIIISTDGDVFVSENSINEIIDEFKNEKIGAVCGKVVSMNKEDNMLSYWSNVSFNEMNNEREKLSRQGKFFEFSGYLLAFRNGVIKEFPLISAEDRVIPYIFYSKNYKLSFVEKAEVYVLNPQNLNDWIKQKKRNIKGYISLKKSFKKYKIKEKSSGLFGEMRKGISFMFKYIKNPKKSFWLILLFYFRFYVWISAYWDIKFKGKKFTDGWRGETQTPSTSPLD